MLGVTRRESLARLLLWVGVLPPAAVSSFFALRFLQPRRRRRVVPVVAAYAADLPRDAALVCDNIVGHRLLLRRERDRIVAFSTICPHMGCSVSWHEAAREFVCPCHEGRFSSDGSPTAGPVDRPLVRFPARQSGELILVDLPLSEGS